MEDITEALWGSKVSPATISELNKKAYVHIEDWRNRPLRGGRYPYVYVDASGGGSGRRRCCRLTSFSRSLQINLRINLDGTDGTNSGRICGYISVFPHLSGHCSGRDRS